MLAKAFLISASDDYVGLICVLESKMDWVRKSTYLVHELLWIFCVFCKLFATVFSMKQLLKSLPFWSFVLAISAQFLILYFSIGFLVMSRIAYPVIPLFVGFGWFCWLSMNMMLRNVSGGGQRVFITTKSVLATLIWGLKYVSGGKNVW